MRTYCIAALTGAALLAAGAVPAAAFDKCYSTISADGRVKIGKEAAMASARWAWHKAAWKARGPRFSNWWYSGDRAIDCWWDGAGVKWWCTARARPCAKI